MEVKTFRDDAQVETRPDGVLLVRGVAIEEFLAQGRVVPLGMKTEIEFKGRVIYRVYTGVSIELPAESNVEGTEPITNPFMLNVRTVDGLFKYGCSVERVDIRQHNEIVVYVTTQEQFKFVRNEPMFEVSLAGSGVRRSTIKVSSKEVKEAQVTVPMRLNEAVQPAAVANPASIASDAKRVEEWLGSVDVDESKVAVAGPVQRTIQGKGLALASNEENPNIKRIMQG